jgi:hypothetical protein
MRQKTKKEILELIGEAFGLDKTDLIYPFGLPFPFKNNYRINVDREFKAVIAKLDAIVEYLGAEYKTIPAEPEKKVIVKKEKAE